MNNYGKEAVKGYDRTAVRTALRQATADYG
jgi:hypothetical protein